MLLGIIEWQLKQGKKIADWWRELFSSCETWCILWSSFQRKAMKMSSLETCKDTNRLKNTLYNSLQKVLVQHQNWGRITNLKKRLPFLISFLWRLCCDFAYLYFLRSRLNTCFLNSLTYFTYFLCYLSDSLTGSAINLYHWLPPAHLQLASAFSGSSREVPSLHPLFPQSLPAVMSATQAAVPDLLFVVVCTHRRWDASSSVLLPSFQAVRL